MAGPVNTPDADQPTVVVVTKNPINALAIGRWGIFDKTGKTEILATGASDPTALIDSCVSIDFDAEFEVSDYPVEAGSFESYNKVERPFVVGMRLARGGTPDQIAAFKKTLDRLRMSLDPVAVLTPEYAHLNVNVVKVSYRRAADRGAAILIADVTLRKIRLGVATSFSNTASPSAASPVDGGHVQARAPTGTEQSVFTSYQANPTYPGVQ